MHERTNTHTNCNSIRSFLFLFHSYPTSPDTSLCPSELTPPVKPLNSGQVGNQWFAPCREVVLSWRWKLYAMLNFGTLQESVVVLYLKRPCSTACNSICTHTHTTITSWPLVLVRPCVTAAAKLNVASSALKCTIPTAYVIICGRLYHPGHTRSMKTREGQLSKLSVTHDCHHSYQLHSPLASSAAAFGHAEGHACTYANFLNAIACIKARQWL